MEIYLENGHSRVEVDLTLLTGGHLSICLLQLPPAIAEALKDAPRPWAVRALRDLLSGGPQHANPVLQEMAPGGDPVLIVLPEYALGSPDWNAVDAAVRAVNRPIVLVAGFGATSGKEVLDWQGAAVDGETRRHLSWDQGAQAISAVRRVNGGWCWIHDPGGVTHCVVYLKNVLQQAYEAVVLDDLQVGNRFLHLKFADVDLFPFICADIIQPAVQNSGSPQGRLRTLLDGVPADRPSLVVGSLLQTGFNQNWAIAIDSLLNTVLANRPGAVALCNIAHDQPVAQEEADKWRSLSGVFAPFGEMPKGQAGLRVARALNAQGIAGAVVRQSHACVTAGLVSWAPFGPVHGAFVFHGEMSCPISADGLVAPIVAAPAIAASEIARFIQRHPPPQGSAPRLAAGIAMLQEQLRSAEPPRPAALLGATLDGVAMEKSRDPDALDQAEVTTALKVGLHALATLRSLDDMEWQTGAELTGQLCMHGQHKHILVWRSPDLSPRAMQRQLSAWRLQGGPHPDLIVLGASAIGDLPDGEIEEDRRDDFSQAPDSAAALPVGGTLGAMESNFTAPRARRRVAGLGLAHVAAVYADYEVDQDAGRVAILLHQIASVFQEGA